MTSVLYLVPPEMARRVREQLGSGFTVVAANEKDAVRRHLGGATHVLDAYMRVRAAFERAEVRCAHGWLRELPPTANDASNRLGNGFDRAWRSILEERGLGDYLWLHCTA